MRLISRSGRGVRRPVRVLAKPERLAVDEDLAGARHFEVVDAAKEGALARAAGADHADDVARCTSKETPLRTSSAPNFLWTSTTLMHGGSLIRGTHRFDEV